MKSAKTQPAQPQPQPSPLLDTRDAAALLGVAPTTLKISRCTGTLLGVEAPAYRKLGARVVRYHADTLHAWLEQFELQTNTGGW